MRTIFAFLLSLLSAIACRGQTGNLELTPTRPLSGSTLALTYLPRNTVLQGVRDFTATAYCFSDKGYRAHDVALKQTGGLFQGRLTVPNEVKLIFFSFHTETIRDNNNGEGYYTLVYQKDGEPLVGSKLALANAFSWGGSRFELPRNEAKAAPLYKAVFAEERNKERYPMAYFRYLLRSKEGSDSALLQLLLSGYEQRGDLSEEVMQELRLFHEWTLKDKARGDAVYRRMQQRYPKGRWRLKEALAQYDEEKALVGKLSLYNEIVNLFSPFDRDEQFDLDHRVYRVVNRLIDSGRYEEAVQFSKNIKNTELRITSLYSLAFKLAGRGFIGIPIDTKKGRELSRQAMQLLEVEKKVMKHRPAYQGETEYRRNLQKLYYWTAEVYAMHLYHSGDSLHAYNLLKQAVAYHKYKHPDRNESLAFLTEKVKGPSAAKQLLEDFIAQSNYTPAMKQQLERLYLASSRKNASWEQYFTQLEQSAYRSLRDKLKEKMILKPAPLFTLKDMAGKVVSLADLKGKVVVVDFWATWCGPCVASFPTMQAAVKKYKDSADVAFLFIDTWENDSNRVQKVTEFFRANNYDFHVLYDEPNGKERSDFVVVSQFGVDGIPTKFVIDPIGNIRFVSDGYNSRPEETLKELSVMITLAKENSEKTIDKGL